MYAGLMVIKAFCCARLIRHQLNSIFNSFCSAVKKLPIRISVSDGNSSTNLRQLFPSRCQTHDINATEIHSSTFTSHCR